MENVNSQKRPKFWGRRASFTLFRNWNCAEATMQVFQDMIGRKEDGLLKAIAGLQAGITASGSTCGVVSGGALALALLHEKSLEENNAEAEEGVVSLAGEYAKWFQDTYSTTLCRERANADFWSLGGLLRYLMPGDKVFKCLFHISKAMQYLHSKKDEGFQETVQRASEAEGEPIHCAQQVLREVREKTSIGDPLLERLSVVLDGGVGLHGGACAALAASVMDLNLLVGSNLRDISYFGATKAFFRGLKNLRVDETEDITEPYGAARGVIEKFKEVTGSLECAAITDRTFSDYKSFQDHISSSKKCEDLINLCITETVQTIQKHTD